MQINTFELATYQVTVMKNSPGSVQESGFLLFLSTVKLLTNKQTKQARLVFFLKSMDIPNHMALAFKDKLSDLTDRPFNVSFNATDMGEGQR